MGIYTNYVGGSNPGRRRPVGSLVNPGRRRLGAPSSGAANPFNRRQLGIQALSQQGLGAFNTGAQTRQAPRMVDPYQTGEAGMGAAFRAQAARSGSEHNYSKEMYRRSEQARDDAWKQKQYDLQLDQNRRAWAQDWRAQANADRTFDYNAQRDARTDAYNAEVNRRGWASEERQQRDSDRTFDYNAQRDAQQQANTDRTFNYQTQQDARQQANADRTFNYQKQKDSAKAVDQPGYWEGVARAGGIDTTGLYTDALTTDGETIKDPNDDSKNLKELNRQHPLFESIDRLRELNPNISDEELVRKAAVNANVRTVLQQKEIDAAKAEADAAKSHHWWTWNSSDYDQKQKNVENLENMPSRAAEGMRSGGVQQQPAAQQPVPAAQAAPAQTVPAQQPTMPQQQPAAQQPVPAANPAVGMRPGAAVNPGRPQGIAPAEVQQSAPAMNPAAAMRPGAVREPARDEQSFKEAARQLSKHTVVSRDGKSRQEFTPGMEQALQNYTRSRMDPKDLAAYNQAQSDLNSPDPARRAKARQVIDMLNTPLNQ